jgi:hypothetical protein
LRAFGKLIVVGIVVFALLQFIRPSIPVEPATAELHAPPEVRHILEKDCYSCHSDQRRLAWFDNIVPGYWLVRHDILTARQHLNFSTLGSKPAAAEKAALYEAVNMAQLGAMPLPQFRLLHPDAKMTPAELATLKAYLAPWKPAVDQPGSAPHSIGKTDAAPAAVQEAAPVSLATVAAEPDGFAFDSSFESWKPISTTDRGDNNTIRLILGNDVAVKAAQSGEISPWPDGARFAKIAWQQQPGPDGLVHPGKFVQVELMVKSAQRYKATEGWGWGRWRGASLKPYGADAHFMNECTGCHQPLRGNDYIYSLPISNAKIERGEVLNNAAAALPAKLPYQPLAWSAITMYVDPRTRSTATLFGNDAAMHAVQAQRADSTHWMNAPAYPPGTVLALVTWAQRDDPHWFGARIPDRPESIEFVQITDEERHGMYRRFDGAELTEDRGAASMAPQRTSFMLGLAPAWLP